MGYKDPERRREYGRAWIRANAKKAREAMRRWRKNHPDKHAAAARARYARDPQRFKRIIESSPNRRSVRRAMRQRRRGLTKGAASFTAEEWRGLVAAYGGRCAYCESTAPLQVDHRMPLARGGSNTIDNVLPACGPCNLRKRLMTEREFRDLLDRERGRSQ